jgi:hypothetical protein
MKRTPEQDALLSRLGASKFSGEGFLGTDHRPVEDIIADDMRTLEHLDVSLEDLAAALHDAYEKTRHNLGAQTEIRPGINGVFYESMGRIPSPFRGDGVFEKGEAVLKDEESGEQLIITSLGIALIEKHGFFQGHGSRYRIDPAKAVQLLGLGDS